MRPALRVVDPGAEAAGEWVWFCGHCAARPPQAGAPAPSARVCGECRLGLLLETHDLAVPGVGDAFLVVDRRMTVQAVSVAAEELFGIDETSAVDRPVNQLLVGARAEAAESSGLASAIGAALAGAASNTTFVRPWNTFGVRMRADVSACGPPRAALIVLEGGSRGIRAVDD